MRTLLFLTAILAAPVWAQDDLPEASGKALTVRICTGCHGADQFAGSHKTENDWDRTIATMTEKGLSITDADYAVVLDYLTKNLGPLPPKTPQPAQQQSAPPASPQTPLPTAREIFKQLIEINTTDSVGDNTKAAEAMAARFSAVGYPAADIQVLAPVARKGNLVVRLHGSGGANGPRSRCCSSGIWMWWKRSAKTGLWIPSPCLRRMAISTDAARWT